MNEPPAPDTQSGGRPTDEASARRAADIYLLKGRRLDTAQSDAWNGYLNGYIDARAESSAALQGARDDGVYWHGKAMEYANRATAAAGERDRAEAAEAENATLRAEVKRVRHLIDLDLTGLALGLSEVRRIVRGHEWLADPEGGRGSYTDDEWDEAAIRREVNDLITGVDEAALKALTESGNRADAAYREPLTDADVARLGLEGIAAGLREQVEGLRAEAELWRDGVARIVREKRLLERPGKHNDIHLWHAIDFWGLLIDDPEEVERKLSKREHVRAAATRPVPPETDGEV